MKANIAKLSEKEKEALRLLLAGHDAKSIARELDLSVHTINDRLRDSRRKLEVTNSREAARILGEYESAAPEKFVHENDAHKEIRIDKSAGQADKEAVAGKTKRPGIILFLLGGAITMISLIIAAVLFNANSGNDIQNNATAANASAASAATVSNAKGLNAARSWLQLVDAQKCGQSWKSAGKLMRSQTTSKSLAAAIKPVRAKVGKLNSRRFYKVTRTSSIPGAPNGSYELIEFKSNFAKAQGAVETVVLGQQSDGWKVVGYFIR